MIRVLTLNIWQEQGPWQRRLEAIERQVRALDPDVICLQEVREVPGRVPNQAATLAAALGMSHCYEMAQPWGDGEEGVAILTRLQLRGQASIELPWRGSKTRRVCLALHVETQEGTSGWVFTTHLAYLPADGLLREQQVRAVDVFVRDTAAKDVAILTGDFNAAPESDEIRFLAGLTALDGVRTYYQDAYAKCCPGERGWTWCSENPYTEPLSWLPRDRRLDYVFVSAEKRAGSGRVSMCRIVCEQPEPDGVRCSDHYGVLAEIEL